MSSYSLISVFLALVCSLAQPTDAGWRVQLVHEDLGTGQIQDLVQKKNGNVLLLGSEGFREYDVKCAELSFTAIPSIGNPHRSWLTEGNDGDVSAILEHGELTVAVLNLDGSVRWEKGPDNLDTSGWQGRVLAAIPLRIAHKLTGILCLRSQTATGTVHDATTGKILMRIPCRVNGIMEDDAIAAWNSKNGDSGVVVGVEKDVVVIDGSGQIVFRTTPPLKNVTYISAVYSVRSNRKDDEVAMCRIACQNGGDRASYYLVSMPFGNMEKTTFIKEEPAEKFWYLCAQEGIENGAGERSYHVFLPRGCKESFPVGGRCGRLVFFGDDGNQIFGSDLIVSDHGPTGPTQLNQNGLSKTVLVGSGVSEVWVGWGRSLWKVHWSNE
jgi:hypothetical protein